MQTIEKTFGLNRFDMKIEQIMSKLQSDFTKKHINEKIHKNTKRVNNANKKCNFNKKWHLDAYEEKKSVASANIDRIQTKRWKKRTENTT